MGILKIDPDGVKLGNDNKSLSYDVEYALRVQEHNFSLAIFGTVS